MPRPRKRAAAPPAQTNAQEAVAAIIQRALQQGPQHSAAKRVKTSHNNTSSSRSNANPQKPKFDSTQCISWFRKYTDPSDPNVLGPEGMERFCADLKVDPEDIVLLIIAWKMNAKNMGYFTQSEWLRGLGDSDVESDSIEKLQKKFTYFYSLLNDPQTFKSIFRYAYDFARDKDQRSMDIETAKAMLGLLLSKTWPLYSEFNEFLGQPKSPKVINKDQWNNIYEFSKTINTDLTNFAIDGAWPVLLDDFVDFMQKKRDASS